MKMNTKAIPTNELLALARVSRVDFVQTAVRAELAERGAVAPERDTRDWTERLPANVRAAVKASRAIEVGATYHVRATGAVRVVGLIDDTSFKVRVVEVGNSNAYHLVDRSDLRSPVAVEGR